MAEEHERAAAETVAVAATTSRLAAAELVAARVEVEAAAAADAARAAAVELKALCGSSISSSAFVDGSTPMSAVAAAQMGTGGAPSGDVRGNHAPGGGGRVDGDRGLYRQRHGHHGIQAVARDIGLGGGWPTLTKTNYVEWAAMMRVRLQVPHMWEAVRYGDVDYDKDR
jgi:hypothetical protein